MDRKQFTFYSSFCDGISRIKNKSARCDAYDAIVRYAMYGAEPDLDSMSDAAALAFIMAKPVLDSSRRKAEAGRKGGESNGEAKASNAEAKQKQERGQDRDRGQMSKENTREKPARFQAPTVDQVAAYCRERGNSVDPQRFVAHYAAVGWKIGKNPMKDWRAAVRTWEGREKESPKPTGSKRSGTFYGGGQLDPAVVRAAYQKQLEEETE